MAEQVKDIISRILKQCEIDKSVSESRLLNDWHNLMGNSLARQCHPVRIEGTTLILKARNKAWQAELASKHDQVLNLVKKNTDMPEITRIIFLGEE